MAIELEIRDGSPHWYLSPDIWTVMNPSDTTESMPIAGTPCYLKARVRNNGSTSVSNATVKFYWANPAIGVNRSTATLIGQSFISLNAGAVEDVLCLTSWVPVFLNEGHECIIAEAFHANDPLSVTTDFNVPTDRHVAQRNLSVLVAVKSMFHMNFEMHNGSRKEQKFSVKVEQIKMENVTEQFPNLKKHLEGKKEGVLKSVEFTNSKCLNSENTDNQIGNTSEQITIGEFGRRQMAITGLIDGDFAFVTVSQYKEKVQTGGLGILIINHKNQKSNDTNSNQ